MALVLVAMAAFGLFLVLLALYLVNSQNRSRLQLRRLRREMESMRRELRTPEEKEAHQRATEAIEAEIREIHGRFDGGGW